MKERQKINIFWFRRDLRLHDNHGLWRALSAGLPVLPLYIFDSCITGKAGEPDHPGINFIFNSLIELNKQLNRYGSSLSVFKENPLPVFEKLSETYVIHTVYCNQEYEPCAMNRDKELSDALLRKQILFMTCRDHVLFSPEEILKPDGKPYTVFTPFMRRWKILYALKPQAHYLSEKLGGQFIKLNIDFPYHGLPGIRFKATNVIPIIREDIIRQYDKTRDFPFMEGTSRLGAHLRYGTVSIREVVEKAAQWNEVFLNELIWREFFMSVMYHFPYTENQSFRKIYDRISWINNEEDFARWCRGETGIPLVDAGMRELNQTGFMHNRVRMVTASFLTKNLLTDWRWGADYFAGKLTDFELSSNTGNWQWVAGTGCDAAPYFRIFNPYEQQKKFDPDSEYIRKWIPHYSENNVSKSNIDLKTSRLRAIEAYTSARNGR